MTKTDVLRLRRVQKVLTRVLVFIAVVALVFTATNVTLFAIAHDVSPWIAWLLDPMVAVALGAVLITDGVLGEYGIRPGGWATCLRWFTGLATWVMNCWHALWPGGSAFGVPRDVDPAALVLHSIPPVLLIVLAEAITHYRREILATIRRFESSESKGEVPGRDGTALKGTHPPVRLGPVPGRVAICDGGRPLPLPQPRAAVPAVRPQRTRKPTKRGAPPRRRTDAELLNEAREKTSTWSAEELTAEAIRAALRIAPARARMLRDTLRAERSRPDDAAIPALDAQAAAA